MECGAAAIPQQTTMREMMHHSGILIDKNCIKIIGQGDVDAYARMLLEILYR